MLEVLTLVSLQFNGITIILEGESKLIVPKFFVVVLSVMEWNVMAVLLMIQPEIEKYDAAVPSNFLIKAYSLKV